MAFKNMKFKTGYLLLAALFFSCSVSFCENSKDAVETEEFDFANGLFSRGMYDMAIDGYNDFLKKYPGSAYAESAVYRIAESYFMAGEYDSALKNFEGFQRKYPAGELNLKAELRKGQVYYLKGRGAEARKILGALAASKENPDLPAQARYYLAASFLKDGEYTSSKQIFEGLLSGPLPDEYRVFTFMSLGDLYFREKDYERSAGSYLKAGVDGKDRTLSAKAFIGAGKAYYMLGEYDKAAEYYAKAAGLDDGGKSYDNAVLGLLTARYMKGDYDWIMGSARGFFEGMKEPGEKARALFVLGNSYLAEGLFEEAGSVYFEAYEKYPGTKFGLRSKLNESRAFFNLKKYAGCLASIDVYISSGTKDSTDEAYYIKAKALALSGKPDEALRTYSLLVKNFRESKYGKQALYDMAWLYADTGRAEEAVKYCGMFADMYPADELSPSALLKSAQENLNLKRYKEAEKDYKSFIARFKGDPLEENAVYQLGYAYFEGGEYDRAIETYGMFKQSFPKSVSLENADYWIGQAYQKKENWDEALAVYSGIVSKGKGEFYGRATEAMAYCYFQKGDYEKAAWIYCRLISDDENYALPEGVYRWVADYYLQNNQSGQSVKALDAMARKYPSNSYGGEIFYVYGESLRQLKDFSKAKEYFLKAIDSGVSSPYLERSYLGLGRIYAETGEKEKAMEMLNSALEKHSDNVTGALARFEMGNLNYGMNNFGDAAKQYMMVAILYDDKDISPRALFQAGICFARTGMGGKAVEAFTELRERYPDSEFADKAGDEMRRIQNGS
ncbi:MAG: tetratricopeptide repeat protein [Candidatus Omnitrophota bacterium]